MSDKKKDESKDKKDESKDKKAKVKTVSKAQLKPSKIYSAPDFPYHNRELSWMDFNSRVLEEAFEKENPILERLNFLAITASNLDEFFMVRVAGVMDRLHSAKGSIPDESGMTAEQQFNRLTEKIHEFAKKQYSCLNRSLIPALKKCKMRFLTISELNKQQRQQVDQYFEKNVFPVLTPLAVDTSRPFPLLANKSLNIAVRLSSDGGDVFAVVQHFEGFLFEACAVTLFAYQMHIGHKLHAYCHVAFALAHFATSPFGVEREVSGFVTSCFGKRLLGIELAYFVVCLHIGGGIAAGGASDGVLVYQLEAADAVQVARYVYTVAHIVLHPFKSFLKHVAQHMAYKRRFARAAHSCHYGEYPEGKIYINVLQVIAVGTVHSDAVAPGAARGGYGYFHFAQQILSSERLLRHLRHHLLRGASKHHFAPHAARTRTDVYDVVGGSHDVLVVFHHYHRVAQIAQLFQHLDQAVGVARVETDGGLVEYIHTAHQRAAQRGG